MNFKIREYTPPDEKVLQQFMEKLQDHIIALDSLRRNRRLPGYGEMYVGKLLKIVSEKNGLILFAADGEAIIGCIAGIIEPETEDDLLERVPTTCGRVKELFVLENYRSQKVGKLLMGAMEDYFRARKCTVMMLEVFQPNQKAHSFYLHQGFEDRMIDMIKLLKA